jgi:hypothetical protein
MLRRKINVERPRFLELAAPFSAISGNKPWELIGAGGWS